MTGPTVLFNWFFALLMRDAVHVFTNSAALDDRDRKHAQDPATFKQVSS